MQGLPSLGNTKTRDINEWHEHCPVCLWDSLEAFSAHWSPGGWQMLSDLHYNFKYFNNCLTTVADTPHQVFYRSFMATKDLLDLNLLTISRAEFLLISPLISLSPWGILNVCHKLQDSRRQMTSALVVHLPLKVSVCKRTFIWIWGEADLVSGQQETRYFRKLFHITAVSWWLHDKAIHSAAAVELRAELCFSNLSYEQLYIRLCNFLLLHMETSTGILLDLALGLAEKHIEWLTQYSYKHFSSLSPEFSSAFIAGYPLVCVHYQKTPGVVVAPAYSCAGLWLSCLILGPAQAKPHHSHVSVLYLQIPPPWALSLKVWLGY